MGMPSSIGISRVPAMGRVYAPPAAVSEPAMAPPAELRTAGVWLDGFTSVATMAMEIRPPRKMVAPFSKELILVPS
jgi:hypothetical protein